MASTYEKLKLELDKAPLTTEFKDMVLAHAVKMAEDARQVGREEGKKLR